MDKENTKKEIIINTFLNEFLSYVFKEDKVLFNNLDKFYNLILFLLNNLESNLNIQKEINLNSIAHANFTEKISIINDFYNQLGINFNLNDLINNGIFNPYIVGSEKEELPTYHTITNGKTYITNNHPSIDVYENDLITDASIWVHELSHYRDLPKDNTNSIIRTIFTESLAFTEELIFADYLDNNDFSYDTSLIKQNIFNLLSITLNKSLKLIKPYLLFIKLGQISKNNYSLYFNNSDDYDEILNYFITNNINSHNYYLIYTYISYTLAFALSTYMYIEYTKNPDFITNIINIKNNLNTYSLEKCLQTINLSNFDNNFFNKIKNNLEDFLYEIINGSDLIISHSELITIYFNTIIDTYYQDKNLAFDNINDFYKLITFLNYEIGSFIENTIPKFEYNKLSKANKKEKLKIINDFYKYIGSNFRLTKNILNKDYQITSINPLEYLEKDNIALLINKIGSGECYYHHQKHVCIYDSGLLYDSITWIHETKHYQNQPNHQRNQISFALTESLSYTEELLFTDYLEKLGYNYESYISKYDTFYNFSFYLNNANTLIKLLYLYINYGEISKPNYKKCFTDDEYEIYIEDSFILLTDEVENFFNLYRYSIASALSIYMYIEYQKDNSFIQKINEFEQAINTKNLYECLKIIGINGLNKETLNKIKTSLDTFKIQLNNIIKSNTIKIYDTLKEKIL